MERQSIAASLFGVGLSWRSGQIKTGISDNTRLIDWPWGRRAGRAHNAWDGTYLICLPARYTPFRPAGVGAESARALPFAKDGQIHRGGAKSLRHTPPVQAAGFPPASAEAGRRATRFWQRDMLHLQRPLTRSPVLDALSSAFSEVRGSSTRVQRRTRREGPVCVVIHHR